MTHSSVARLRAAAQDARLRHVAPELRDLAEAIEEGGDRFAEFAYIDLSNHFGGDLADEPTRPRWLAAIQAMPGVLVYVPLLITWAGLAAATSAQGRLVNRGVSLEGSSFLGLWQSGFRGELPTFLRFGHVALLTALTLLLTLAVVSSAAFLGGRWDRSQDRLSAQSLTRLAEALRAAERFRSSWRSEFERRSRADLDEAASEVRGLQTKASLLLAKSVRAAEALDEQSQSLSAAATTISEATAKATASSGRVEKASEAALFTSQELDAAITALKDLVQETQRHVSANATAAQQRVERLGDELASLLDDYGKDVSGAALKAIADMSWAGSSGLAESLLRLEGQFQAITEAVRAGAASSVSVVDTSGQLLSRIEHWDHSARESTDSLTRRLEELSRDFASTATALRDAMTDKAEPAGMA